MSNKDPWDYATKERLTLIAWSYGEVSEGRAVELLGKGRDVLRKRLEEYTGATMPSGTHMSYAAAVSIISDLKRAIAGASNE